MPAPTIAMTTACLAGIEITLFGPHDADRPAVST